MFASRYFADRCWAPRYWPKVGSGATVVAPTQTAQGGHHGKSRRQRRADRWARDREIHRRQTGYAAPQRMAERRRAMSASTPAAGVTPTAALPPSEDVDALILLLAAT